MRRTKRDRILSCSQRVLARQGYQNTTISDIVREAQVSRATFYLHFANKRQLLEELLDGLFSRLEKVIVRVDRTEKEQTIGSQLIDNLVRVLDTFETHQDLARLLMRESYGIDPEFDERIRSFYDRIGAMVIRSVNRGMQMGIVRECDAELIATCIIGQCKEIITERLINERLKIEHRKIAIEVLQLNLTGILTGPLALE